MLPYQSCQKWFIGKAERKGELFRLHRVSYSDMVFLLGMERNGADSLRRQLLTVTGGREKKVKYANIVSVMDTARIALAGESVERIEKEGRKAYPAEFGNTLALYVVRQDEQTIWYDVESDEFCISTVAEMRKELRI